MDKRFTYWPRVVGRALTDSLSFFGGWRIVFVPIFFLIGSLVHLYRAGPEKVIEEFSVWLSYTGLAFVLCFLVLLFLNFIRTPPQMEEEAEASTLAIETALREKIDALEVRLYNKEARQAALVKLWQLRDRGVKIRNKAIKREDFPEWKAAEQNWRSEIFAEAEKVSPSLKAWIQILDQVRPPPALSSQSVVGEHQALREQMSERLARIEEFLKADMLHRDIEKISDQ
jgi:hypothetical protein